jgi:hypothetical protein
MQCSPALKIGDPFTQTVFSPVADLSRRHVSTIDDPA